MIDKIEMLKLEMIDNIIESHQETKDTAERILEFIRKVINRKKIDNNSLNQILKEMEDDLIKMNLILREEKIWYIRIMEKNGDNNSKTMMDEFISLSRKFREIAEDFLKKEEMIKKEILIRINRKN